MVSFVIPGYNNLRHLKNCYQSVKRHAPDCEMIIIDDGSTDGTWEWARLLMDPNVQAIRFDERRGHTIRYDYGISIAKHDIVGILHCDMIIGPNYVKNMLKHLKPKTVVCGTRVEPPIHPPGREKIIMDFGMDFDDLRVHDFDAFCRGRKRQTRILPQTGCSHRGSCTKKTLTGSEDTIHYSHPFPTRTATYSRDGCSQVTSSFSREIR